MYGRKNLPLVAAVGIAVLTAVGCDNVTQNNNVPSTSNATNRITASSTSSTHAAVNRSAQIEANHPTPKSVSNVILAKSVIPGHAGRILELVDVNGQYINDPTLGAYQGDNWTGKFQLQVVSSTGKVLSTYALPDNQYTKMRFQRKFEFHFADYNEDGNPDFTLGQYGGSNGNWYQIFTIKPTGIAQLYIKPAQLFVSDHAYSPLFERIQPNGFRVKYYDNAKPGWFQASYIWKRGEFEQSGIKAVPANGE